MDGGAAMRFTEFRSTVPLTDADFADIRAKVMAEVQRKQTHAPFVFRLVFAAMVVVVLIGTGLLLTIRRPAEVEDSGPPLSRQPKAAVLHQEPPSAAVLQPASRHHHRRTPPRAAESQVVSQIHMEIQTADPDVRIIWIENSNSR
jgi:hypothetical protein